ncbi:MAG: gas vesicle protein GvpJ [Leptolyngbyaceae cyanobacterium bins.302]|nr:gas vesicle protein GvpJ [Leptolyngbyaceae cyanobacterium bins.302]
MTAAIPTKAFPVSTKDSARAIQTSTMGSTLADVLERVLDKGIVIAGDISVSVANTELLNIRLRLLISSVDKAREIGINWWENNPHFSAQTQELLESNRQLQARVDSLETELKALRSLPPSSHPVSASHPAAETTLDSLGEDLLGL